MGGVFTEERAISHAQYLDLVYSESGMLYDLIPQAPLPSTDPANPPTQTLIDGVVGLIQPSSTSKPSKQTNSYTTTPSTPTVSTGVNSIQISEAPDNKKKGKGKNKKPGNQQPMRMIKG